MVSFPETKKTFTQIVDGVTKVEAININTSYDEIEALETFLGASGNAQSKNAGVNNLFRNMFTPYPVLSWTDVDTISIEARTVVMYNGSDYVIKRNTSSLVITLSGDLDTGLEAGDTWYYVWLVGDGASTTYTAEFSLSSSAVPDGATYAVLIGAVYNDTGSDILEFVQTGKWVHFVTPQADFDGNPTDDAWQEDLQLTVPAGVSTLVMLQVFAQASTATNSAVTAYFRIAGSAEAIANINKYIHHNIIGSGTSRESNNFMFRTNATGLIDYYTAGAATFELFVTSFYLNLI